MTGDSCESSKYAGCPNALNGGPGPKCVMMAGPGLPIGGGPQVRALPAATALRIAAVLAAGKMTVADLAARPGVDPELLMVVSAMAVAIREGLNAQDDRPRPPPTEAVLRMVRAADPALHPESAPTWLHALALASAAAVAVYALLRFLLGT
jgi:hypothetical protein